MYMLKCWTENNPNCEYCGFTEDIWKHYQTILAKLAGQKYTPQQYLFLNTQNTNKNNVKLTTTIIQIILFEIWQSSNNNVYDKKLLPQHTIIYKINAKLKTIILTHYKKLKLHDTLETFHDQFCINEAVAKLQNGLLTMPLQIITLPTIYCSTKRGLAVNAKQLHRCNPCSKSTRTPLSNKKQEEILLTTKS